MPRRKFGSSQPAAYLYTGGHTTKHRQGYILEYCPDHPACNLRGYVMQHRLVMERHLGRYLTGREVVHHKNEVPTDNRIENLELLDSQSEHMRLHHRQNAKRYDPEIIEMVRKAAADPKVSQSSLPLSPQTILEICKQEKIEWISAAHSRLTEDQVREALQGRTTAQAAAFLGVHHQTLRNRFDHLLTKRKSPTKRAKSESGA